MMESEMCPCSWGSEKVSKDPGIDPCIGCECNMYPSEYNPTVDELLFNQKAIGMNYE